MSAQTIYGVLTDWRVDDMGVDPGSDDWLARSMRAEAARTLRARRPVGVPSGTPTILAVMERTGLARTAWRTPCPLCGEPLKADHKGRRRVSVDHIIPLIRGGQHHIDNLQIVHAACNSAKRDRVEN